MGQTNGTTSHDRDAPSTAQGVFGSFGKLLKHLRRRARLTQADLAIAVGYSREQITKLENGQRTPELTTVRALLVPALGLDVRSDVAAELLRLAEAAHASKAETAGVAHRVTAVPPRTNLMPALTSFVGRVQEVGEVKRLVANTRLLALIGTGGVGKTRLALQAAAELLDAFPDGVWLAELAPVNDPLLVPHAVAVALGLSASAARPIDQQLTDFLHNKHLLLILDNCEHMLVACARLAEGLLRTAPQLHILATSRESLGVLSATAWQVPSLTLPPSPTRQVAVTVEEALCSEAVQLFVARATMAKPGWSLLPGNVAAVVAICRRLDGVPLAIELAATRVRAMSVQQIAGRLDDRFRLLAGGNSTALPRHQTLRAMVDWSYELLSEQEQALLRQLSVFAGGWTLESAEWVYGPAALDLLAQLVDKSLVLMDDRARTVRYRMLETIGQYGRDKLVEAGEASIAHRRHLEWCRLLLRQASPCLPRMQEAPWYEQLESEHENVQSALAWAVTHEPQLAVELVAGVWHLWFWRGYWREGVDWSVRVFAAAATLDTPAGACALVGAANIAGRGGDYAMFSAWLDQGSAIAEALGVTEARAWAIIAQSVQTREYARSSALLEEALALARSDGNLFVAADVLCVLGDWARTNGEYDLATTRYHESLALFRQLGSVDMVPWPLGNLGRVAFEHGDYDRARATFAECVDRCRALGNRPGTADWLLQLALAQLRCHDYAAAQRALNECLPIYRAIGNTEAIADCLVIASGLAEAQGRYEQAARLLGAVGRVLEQFNLLHQGSDPAGYVEYQQRLATVQAALGAESFATAQAEGRAWSLSQAVACVVPNVP